MAPTEKKKPCYGQVPFHLDAADLEAAKDMGFLNVTVSVQQCDPSKEDYGVAYANRDNVGTAYHASQRQVFLQEGKRILRSKRSSRCSQDS
ncbi:hypothetical protein DVH05_021877 [Phytophthora capsici]|nr:hypothetical protein DVH05_021877 [Phytophthora capsici]